MPSSVENLLGSFSTVQLRDLAFAMSSRGVPLPKASLSKEQLLAELRAKAADAFLALFAHRIEAVTPYKHLFVYSLDAAKFNFTEAKARIETAFPGLLGTVREINPQIGELDAQACVADEHQNRIYLKLVHQVEMSGWVTISRTEKRLEEFRRRHPVVVTFRPSEGIVTIGFPGFTYTHGVQHENRMVYAEIATEVTEFLKTKLHVECEPFGAKPAIDTLLEQEPDQVVDIRRSVRPLKGGRFAFDAGEEGKLTTALTDFLSREGDILVSETQIRSLLRRSAASDVVLLWKGLRILTRIALLAGGPEFLFVWRESGPSSAVVDTVLQKVTSYERLVRRPDLKAARNAVLDTPLDQVVRPAIAAQQYGVSLKDVLHIVNEAVARGDFAPRFRVNTDNLIIEFENTWRVRPSDLPPKVVDETGSLLDLTLPTNIEVGFQRLK